jgi:hypothetical protein
MMLVSDRWQDKPVVDPGRLHTAVVASMGNDILIKC